MKKMKKILSIVLSFLLIATIIPWNSIMADAASLDSRVEAAIQWAISIANDDSHGYSQSNRNGPNYDCSSFVSTAFKNGGFSVSGSLNTSSMADAFVKVGFTKYKKGDVAIQRGDILLKPGSHVELYLGNDTCVAAHSNYDGVSGDGNGKEIQVRKKNYCTFCKQAKYTYILRYNSTTSNTYSYSFNFNANGGTLGSAGSFTTSYGQDFQILNTTCTRSGYTWAGWNVKRNNDNKWYVAGKGWCTESEISTNGYNKKVYSNYQTCKLDDSWINGISGNGSYTFYAVWIQSRVDTLKVFFSPYGEGCDHTTALNNRTSSGYAQDQIYAWYILYDGNTGDLMNSYSSKTYSVELAVRDPNGNLVYNHTYSDSGDANWIGVTPQMSGTYTATATISGAYTGSISTTYNVSYDTELMSSANSISLNLNDVNTKTPTITISGNYPGNYGVKYQFADSEIASAAWSGKWDGNSTSLSVTGKKYGSTNLIISVYENYTGNKNIVKQITIPVVVYADSYSINYNANGGSGAPSSQTKHYGTDINLSSSVPTRSGYTFLGWATSSSATSATYLPGETYTTDSNITLYAVWEKEIVLSSIEVYSNPSKTNYYIGDSFSGSGLVIKLTYSDGTTKNISTGFTTSGFSAETAGTKTVTVYYQGKTATFTVTVDTPSVSLSSTGKTMSVGDTNTLTATTTPSGQSVTWKSSDTSVATVSNGTITAKATGIATITVEFTYNGIVYSDTCTVTVVKENTLTGQCGDNLNYSLDLDTGSLTVSGTGDMWDWTYQNESPWFKNKIKSVSIDDGVTSIGERAFIYQESITQVSLPDSLRTIGDAAFWCVNSLTSIVIPKNVTSVGTWSHAFSCAHGLQSIIVDSGNDYFCSVDGVLYNKEKTLIIQYPNGRDGAFSIPETVTTIGNSALAYSKKLTHVNIPSSVSKIDVAAFSGCTSLKEIVIPETVSYIGRSAFESCKMLEKVCILNSNTIFDDDSDYLIFNYSNLVVIYGLENSTAQASAEKNNIKFVLHSDAGLLGDVNGDGVVDAGDAVIISRYDAGLITLTSEQLKAGDVNGDGTVDAGDSVIISRYDAGLISSLN